MNKRVLKAGLAAMALTGAVQGVSPAGAVAAPTFVCEPGFYQVVAGQLAELQPGTGVYEKIGQDYSNYNAMGYRIADGYLYAMAGNTLYRVDAEGTRTDLAQLSVPKGAYTGDFGDDGLLHISRGGRDWYKVDVDTFAATAVPELSGNIRVADIANVHGVFYGVSAVGHLYRIDPTALTVTDVGLVAGLSTEPKAYGAAWATAGGNLYVGRNSGEVYQITGYSTSSPQATHISNAPPTNSNDGASCSLAPVPDGLNDVDGAAPETPPQTPEAIQAAADYEASFETISESFVEPISEVGETSTMDYSLQVDDGFTESGGGSGESSGESSGGGDAVVVEDSGGDGSGGESSGGESSSGESSGGDGSVEVGDAGIGQGAACDPTVDVDRLERATLDELIAVTEPTVLYSTTFDGNELINDWWIASGNWTMEDGHMKQLNACGFDYTALLPGYLVKDFEVEATFSAISAINQGGIVINQSSTSTRSGAMIVDLFDSGTEVRWGTYDPLGYHEYVGSVEIEAPAPGQNVTLKLVVHDNDVAVYLDGQLITNTTTDDIGGMIGLVANKADIAFDSITLTALPPVS